MGCEESHMISNTDLDLEVLPKTSKTPNRKKNPKEPLRARLSGEKVF